MAKPDTLKKSNKVSGSATRKLAAYIRLGLDEPSEKRANLRNNRKRSNRALSPLSSNPDHVAPKVNRRKREAGLTDPAALPVADAVRGEHPSLAGITAAKLAEIQGDLAMLGQSNRRLFARLARLESQLEARVAVAESALERLAHYHAQYFDLLDGGTGGSPVPYAPLEEITTNLPAYLSGGVNFTLPKEGAESVPSIPGTLKGERTTGVPLGEEAPDPGREGFSLNHEWTAAYFLGLNRPSRIPEPSRFTRLVRRCVA